MYDYQLTKAYRISSARQGKSAMLISQLAPMSILYHMHFFKQTFVLDNFYKNCASNSSLLQYIYDLNEKLNSGFGPSSKDLSISLLKLLECRMQWYIDFITWTSRPYFRLITGSSFTVFVLCRLNHIRCIRVTHSSLNR